MQKVVPSPSLAVAAEQNEHESSDGENIVADNEIFKIENRASFSKGLNVGESVKTENAGQGKYEHGRTIDE